MPTRLRRSAQDRCLAYRPGSRRKRAWRPGYDAWKQVFKVAVNTLGRIVDETLAANQLEKSDLDWLIPHQANLRIIKATAKKTEHVHGQVIVTVDKHGNTSAASVPMALDVAIRSVA